MDTINIEDFSKVEIRIGKVLEAEAVVASDKLIKQTVDFGEFGKRTILSGIRKWYEPEDLVGKLLPYVVNLEPREIMGYKSEGMLLAAAPEVGGEKTAVLISPENETEAGAKVV